MQRHFVVLGRPLRLPFAAAVALGLTLASVPTQTAAATTISVSTAADELNSDGDCSLREAVRAANLDRAVDRCPAGSGADTIVLPAGTFRLTVPGRAEDAAASGDFDIAGVLAIAGAGRDATVVSGGDPGADAVDRIFDVLPGADVRIADLALRGGDSYNDPGGDLDEPGGAVRNRGSLLIERSAIDDNTAPYGAAVFNSGTLALKTSTLLRNTADGAAVDNTGTLDISDSVIRESLRPANQDFIGGGGLQNSGIATLTRVQVVANGDTGIGNSAEMTITDSSINDNSALESGGGIVNRGTLAISGSTISSNSSFSRVYGGAGAGIKNYGTLTLERSLISNNYADGGTNSDDCLDDNGQYDALGGGIYNHASAALTVVNSTISGNRASRAVGQCGPVGRGGGIFSAGVLTLRSSTVSGNTAFGIRRGGGGGVAAEGRSTVLNTILADNQATNGPDCAATLLGAGYNLLENPAGCTTGGNGNVLHVDPRLGPLQNNGGPTPTRALPAGSPAVDSASPVQPGGGDAACAPRDQRNIVRPIDGNRDGTARCDIGAYELGGPPAYNLKGDFEADENSDGSPDGWSLDALAARSGEAAHSGRYSLSFKAANNRDARIYQVVAGLTGGKRYQFGGWANIPATGDSFSFSFAVAWKNAAGDELRVDPIKSYTGATSGWNQATAQLTSPAGTDHAVVRLNVASLAATVFVDDVSFRPR